MNQRLNTARETSRSVRGHLCERGSGCQGTRRKNVPQKYLVPQGTSRRPPRRRRTPAQRFCSSFDATSCPSNRSKARFGTDANFSGELPVSQGAAVEANAGVFCWVTTFVPVPAGLLGRRKPKQRPSAEQRKITTGFYSRPVHQIGARSVSKRSVEADQKVNRNTLPKLPFAANLALPTAIPRPARGRGRVEPDQ